MENEDFLSREKSRGSSYRLLSDSYLMPDEGLRETLAGLAGSLENVCPEATRCVPRIGDKTDIETLKIEHSKLFVGPYKLLAPPYGSVYLEGEGTLMGNSTIDVRNMYREAGLDVSEGHKDAPDHISAELEFMYFLIFKWVESVEKSELDGVKEHLNRQMGFLENHLGAWVSEFAERVEDNAETEFYKNLARCTQIFVEKDLEKLKVTMAELPDVKDVGG